MIRGIRLRAEKEKSDQDEKECDWKEARKRETNEDFCVQSGKPVRKASDEKIETP